MPLIKFLLLCSLILLTACSSSPPAPTPVPTANQLVQTLQSAHLEVTDIQPVEELPAGGVEGLKFYTPSLCDGCSSMVFVFDSEASAVETKGMIEQAGKASETFKFFVYHNGRVLLRMGGLIDQTQADKYAQALNLK